MDLDSSSDRYAHVGGTAVFMGLFTPKELGIYTYLRMYRPCFVSVNRISEDFNVHRTTICRTLKSLKDKGLITVRGRESKFGTNLYEFPYEKDNKNGVAELLPGGSSKNATTSQICTEEVAKMLRKTSQKCYVNSLSNNLNNSIRGSDESESSSVDNSTQCETDNVNKQLEKIIYDTWGRR